MQHNPIIASIVACGDSAKHWYKVPVNFSIGCNDCVKFGYEVNYLVCVDSPFKFQPKRQNGYIDRHKIIIDSKPERFYCHNSNWKKWFPQAELLSMQVFIGTYRKNRVYSSKTSPFVAITKAVELGATELIIWGVDFINHHQYAPGKSSYNMELSHYRLLFEQLQANGIKLWIGDENTALKEFLPTYKSISSNSEVMEK